MLLMYKIQLKIVIVEINFNSTEKYIVLLPFLFKCIFRKLAPK